MNIRTYASFVLLLAAVPALAADSLSTVILRFAGDCLLAGHYEAAAGDNPALAFQNFDLFRTADVAMVNLEHPVTTWGVRVEKPYNFRMNPRFVRALKDAGVTVVNIANNHIFDFGPEGLFDTISYLDSAGILHVGAGRNSAEARQPVIIRKAGIKIGLLGFYQGGEAPQATRESPGVAMRDLDVVAADIRSLKTRDSVDFVVVTFHWGDEKTETPKPEHVWFARRVVESGADLIIGHHPHVLQGIEQYKSGVIVYSLGNFIFGGNARSTYKTGVFEVVLGRGAPRFRFIPVAVHRWRASPMTGPDSAAVLDSVKRLSSRFPSTIFNN